MRPGQRAGISFMAYIGRGHDGELVGGIGGHRTVERVYLDIAQRRGRIALAVELYLNVIEIHPARDGGCRVGYEPDLGVLGNVV